jgi:hypothetical protein
MLCNSCQNIFNKHHDLDTPYIHHEDVYSLQQQAEEGCHLCTLMWEQFDESKQLKMLANESPTFKVFNKDQPHTNCTELSISKNGGAYDIRYMHPRLDFTNFVRLLPSHGKLLIGSDE